MSAVPLFRRGVEMLLMSRNVTTGFPVVFAGALAAGLVVPLLPCAECQAEGKDAERSAPGTLKLSELSWFLSS